MAPARMMQFVDQHVKNCQVCKNDLILPEEIEKIREFVLPESKIPKASRSDDSATPEISPDEDGEFEDEDEFGDDEDSEEDEMVDDDLNEDDII